MKTFKTPTGDLRAVRPEGLEGMDDRALLDYLSGHSLELLRSHCDNFALLHQVILHEKHLTAGQGILADMVLLDGPVGNGGFQDFLTCADSCEIQRVLYSLRIIGATKVHDLVLRACIAFPESLSMGLAERTPKLTQAVIDELCELDPLYYALSWTEDSWEAPVVRYIRAHMDEFFR